MHCWTNHRTTPNRTEPHRTAPSRIQPHPTAPKTSAPLPRFAHPLPHAAWLSAASPACACRGRGSLFQTDPQERKTELDPQERKSERKLKRHLAGQAGREERHRLQSSPPRRPGRNVEILAKRSLFSSTPPVRASQNSFHSNCRNRRD